MKIVVIGAGAFGTALACVFSRGNHHVVLKPRRKEHAIELNEFRENRTYLPGIALPKELVIDDDVSHLKAADLILLATPVQKTSEILQDLASQILPGVPFLCVGKGILNQQTYQVPFLRDWLHQNFKDNPCYILSGPNFAHEIAKGLPAAATLAYEDEQKVKTLAESLWHPYYRIYPTTDVMGVQFAGAVKNVYAIASGICYGLNMGQNALATMITRALAEIKRLGVKLGASHETFLGLSGVGDLMLTCTSPVSRNMSLGIELSKGRSLNEILAQRKSITEGVETAKALHHLSQSTGIQMRIAEAVYSILHENQDLQVIVDQLLKKDQIRFESD